MSSGKQRSVEITRVRHRSDSENNSENIYESI